MKQAFQHPVLAVTLVLTLLGGAVLFNRPAAEAALTDEMGSQLKLFRELLATVEDVNRLAQSPSGAAIAAAMGLKDQQGDPAATIVTLNELLPQVDDPAVQRAIRIQLSDLYKNTGQREKAVGELKKIILGKVAAN